MIDETLPWLTFPPAVDLSNTIVVTPRGELDLLTTDQQLDVWIAAERGRIPSVHAAAGRLHDVRNLRADLRALLYAHAHRRPLPDAPRRRLNALSAAAPTYPTLDRAGSIIVKQACDDPYANFAAELARSAIQLLTNDDTTPRGVHGTQLRAALPTRPPTPTMVLPCLRQPRPRRTTRSPPTLPQAPPGQQQMMTVAAGRAPPTTSGCPNRSGSCPRPAALSAASAATNRRPRREHLTGNRQRRPQRVRRRRTRPDSASGVVIASTLRSSLFTDGDRSARHLSRMPRTEPRPSSFCSAIEPAVDDAAQWHY